MMIIIIICGYMNDSRYRGLEAKLNRWNFNRCD